MVLLHCPLGLPVTQDQSWVTALWGPSLRKKKANVGRIYLELQPRQRRAHAASLWPPALVGEITQPGLAGGTGKQVHLGSLQVQTPLVDDQQGSPKLPWRPPHPFCHLLVKGPQGHSWIFPLDTHFLIIPVQSYTDDSKHFYPQPKPLEQQTHLGTGPKVEIQARLLPPSPHTSPINKAYSSVL